MQPFAIKAVGQGADQVQIVDPMHPEVIKLITKRSPYWLIVPLVWEAPRVIGNTISNPTQERRFDLLLTGARSALNYSQVKLKKTRRMNSIPTTFCRSSA